MDGQSVSPRDFVNGLEGHVRPAPCFNALIKNGGYAGKFSDSLLSQSCGLSQHTESVP